MASKNKETNYDIFNFLDETLIEKGKKFTHTSMGKPTGSYYIENENIDIFNELYQKAIFDGKTLHITEKHDDIGPIIIDLDFKYEFEVNERQHNKDFVKKIVKMYNETILELLDINEHDNRLESFVFERNQAYKTKGITKDGIHILYPKIVTSPEVQYYIREIILKKISGLLEEIPLINKPYDVVDKSVIFNTNWLLYGSSKPNLDPYILKYIFNSKLNEVEPESYNFDMNIVKFFSIRNKKQNELINVKENKAHLIENVHVKSKTLKQKSVKIFNDDIELLRSIIELLNDDRAESYADWIGVGWALHNIDPNSQELLDLWIDFSKRSPKFKDGSCEKEWFKSRDEGYGIATLHYWAKVDNTEKYKKIMEDNLDKYIEKSIKTPTHCDIANVLYKLFKYDFKYSGQEWYKFENHVWYREMDGICLRSKISTDLCEIYFKIISKYNKIQTSNNMNISDEEKEEFKNKGKEILEIIKKLKTTSFKDNILKECKELFYDKDFMNKLDNNPYLIGFKNGVYDLKTGELREGHPDDYIQMTTGIDKIDFEETNEHWGDLKHFIDTVFYEEEMRNYFLTYFASCLQGHNAEEKFRIWTGVGSNGKSKILELFVNSIGEYSIKFPITMLTGKRAASNACTPEIVQSKGKRFGYFEEPSENEKINAGLLKEFTGGDKIKARGLHKEPIEFKPQFKLALLCNEMPEVPPYDNGTWRRMEVIEFKSKFCENPREPNEFPIDKYLSEKLKNWKELFIALLLDVYYKDYRKNSIKVPIEVIKFTLEYQKQCDLYTDFITENLEDTKDDNDIIELNELYDEFKTWYEETFSNNKYPSKVEFKKYLKKKYLKKVSTKELKGFKFKLKNIKLSSTTSFDNNSTGY
jgi:P4 family phage/plasmid primase-like protien